MSETPAQTVDTTVDTPWTPTTVDTTGGVISPGGHGYGWRGDPGELVAAVFTDPRTLVRSLVPAVPEWHAHAACQHERSDVFFIAAGSGLRAARAICAACPVKQDCLDAALDTPESADFGTWGGTTASERRKLRRAREEGVAP